MFCKCKSLQFLEKETSHFKECSFDNNLVELFYTLKIACFVTPNIKFFCVAIPIVMNLELIRMSRMCETFTKSYSLYAIACCNPFFTNVFVCIQPC